MNTFATQFAYKLLFMDSNTFGKDFRLTTFGESHGDFIGGILEGLPAGMTIDLDFIRSELNRRKPHSAYSTQRTEDDEVRFISGMENFKTLGTPLAFIIRNNNARKSDYDNLKNIFRPSHGDYTYFRKYGINALSGGGRASARETTTRVVGGALAKLFLKPVNITIKSEIESIGGFNYITQRKEVEKALKKAKESSDSLGGVIKCTIQNVPAGLGEPVFDKLSAVLAHAMMSIPSARSFETGDGKESCNRFGSQDIDHWNEDFTTKTNHCGGIQAGISNGMDIIMHVGFKPISSIGLIRGITREGKIKETENKGRHDTCAVLRCGVITEAMAALTIADFIKRSQYEKR